MFEFTFETLVAKLPHLTKKKEIKKLSQKPFKYIVPTVEIWIISLELSSEFLMRSNKCMSKIFE